ncbi:MAG TPA: tripartite tricarboxylate transporter substrate binding protein [Casimicrobiaceae bacterium]|jgi:tripartite-type tricarboxylate transporter receptor subunit TctC|nr:tripartite tricarboxylate transporter substrate binding protein [Casimicrobiaceae bacterium]
MSPAALRFRSLACQVAALLGVALLPASVVAQQYPARAVKIIVPFAAGGPADVYARFVARRLQEALGQPFVVDDRPGAGSVVGTDAAAKSAPDGYTLLLISNTHTVNESLLPSKPFALLRDFVPVAPINYSDLVMVVHPSVPAKTLAEFIALAKAQPGKLNYASSGPGTPYHMAGELFKAMAGVDIVHVPYRGSSGARTDLIGGQVQMMFDAVTTMSEHVKAGQVRALGTSGRTRSTVLPEVPTVAEAGVPGYEATIWLGVVAPKGTPPAIVGRLNAEITQIVSRPEVRREWAEQGAIAMVMTPDAFGKYIVDDIAKWGRIVKVSGAKPDQ